MYDELTMLDEGRKHKKNQYMVLFKSVSNLSISPSPERTLVFSKGFGLQESALAVKILSFLPHLVDNVPLIDYY